MKYFYVYITLFSLCFISCKADKGVSPESLEKTIRSLKSNEDKRAYLENVFFEYQHFLTEEDIILKSDGSDSEAYKNFIIKKSKEEEIYLSKIGKYFEVFGYPSRTELGQYASIAPLIVYFYATNDKGFQKEDFKYFYGAYKFKDIPEEYFLEYIKAFYESNTGKIYSKTEKYLSPEEEIYVLMDALGYDY